MIKRILKSLFHTTPMSISEIVGSVFENKLTLMIFLLFFTFIFTFLIYNPQIAEIVFILTVLSIGFFVVDKNSHAYTVAIKVGSFLGIVTFYVFLVVSQ